MVGWLVGWLVIVYKEKTMTREERMQRIESYGRAYETLVEGVKQFPVEMWHFKASPEGWSIHEILIHITDSEANSYIRCRRFIAEPKSSVMSYDEMQWARALNYAGQSTQEALELFKGLRRSSYQLIRELPEATWQNTVYHPENGIMTMDDWLYVYERHIPDHLAQMREVYAEWIASHSTEE